VARLAGAEARGHRVIAGLLPSAYSRLPENFYARLPPTPVAKPRLIQFNTALASELGLDTRGADGEALAAIFSGNHLPPGLAPIAMAYAGHQFGHFSPQLGDGRAILIADALDRSGARRDVQLKGSGRTPFSRSGDGRAALGPVLREYLVSEAMHALGVPTTRSLAAVSTGEWVMREQRLPGAIVTRVAASHVRVGTFEYFAARGQAESIRVLADYVIDRHYADARSSDRPYLSLLRSIVHRQAQLIARWMQVGFIHGVMNTDNMALSGETIDFGPCAFMDGFDPATVFSSIDSFGRYAYGNQPRVAQWNLARFAETLLPLIDPDPERAVELGTEAVRQFTELFDLQWLEGMRLKLGLSRPEEGDRDLVQTLLDLMHGNQADFTLAFRHLADVLPGEPGTARVRTLFENPGAFDAWVPAWQSRLEREPRAPRTRAESMRRANPAFIPRNHRIEQAIVAAVESEDFQPFLDLLAALSRPFDDQPRFAKLLEPPQPNERVLQTFCGT
jgi:serine/tyrosine/threonine adenylyltransferase